MQYPVSPACLQRRVFYLCRHAAKTAEIKRNLMVHFSGNSSLYCGDNWPKAFEDDGGGGRQVGEQRGVFLRFYSDTYPTRYDTSKSNLQQEFA